MFGSGQISLRLRRLADWFGSSPKVTKSLWLAIGLAIAVGLLLRLYNVLDYQAFAADQARDAFVYAGMRHGIWPTLGPPSSYGGYSLPATYYYLVFPFSLISNQPVLQAIPNFLASCATMLLLPLYCYRFTMGNFDKRWRLLAATFAAAWAAGQRQDHPA